MCLFGKKNKYFGSCCIIWGKLLIGIGDARKYNLGVWLEFLGGVKFLIVLIPDICQYSIQFVGERCIGDGCA